MGTRIFLKAVLLAIIAAISLTNLSDPFCAYGQVDSLTEANLVNSPKKIEVTKAVWNISTMMLTVKGTVTPALAGERVVVQNPYNGEIIGTTVSGADGRWHVRVKNPSQIPSEIYAVFQNGTGINAVKKVSGGSALGSSGYQVFAFNDLGMHCYDPTFSVWSILPLFNAVHAQVISVGAVPNLLSNSQVKVTYIALADPTGSINTTSMGKSNFWKRVKQLYDVSPAVDVGLPVGGISQSMPGDQNTPQPFLNYDPSMQWFSALGIPITDFDDDHQLNYLPLMRVRASGSQGRSTVPTVLPVSGEMNCDICHLTGNMAATPEIETQYGITFSAAANPVIQYKQNVLILHRARHGVPEQTAKSVLCASCHVDPVLQGIGYAQDADPGIPSLSVAMHGTHAAFIPQVLNSRQSCYDCHPGQRTNCLRGAMASAGIGCIDCHGSMVWIADASRMPWMDEPKCQSCHTGDFVSNVDGIVRDTYTFTGGPDNPQFIAAPNSRFAENPGRLFRDSIGHNGVACESCHGSPHAIWPSRELNDNMAAMSIQGHSGPIIECVVCHGTNPPNSLDGPHGMHPVGSNEWIDGHENFFRSTPQECQACHGLQGEGTFLSQAAINRSFVVEDRGLVTLLQGYRVNCTLCHENPFFGENTNVAQLDAGI